MIYNALRIDFWDVVFALIKLGILVNNSIESYFFQVADLWDWVDCAHNKLIEMSIYKQLRLTAKHWFDNAPDDFLDLFWNFQHLAQFNRGLSRCLQHSAKKEVVRKNFLNTFNILLLGLLLLLFHKVKNFDNTRASFPGKFTNDSYFDFSKLVLNLWWHVWIQFQKDVENSPKVESRLINKLNDVEELHFFYVLDEKLNFTGANNNWF